MHGIHIRAGSDWLCFLDDGGAGDILAGDLHPQEGSMLRDVHSDFSQLICSDSCELFRQQTQPVIKGLHFDGSRWTDPGHLRFLYTGFDGGEVSYDNHLYRRGYRHCRIPGNGKCDMGSDGNWLGKLRHHILRVS